MPHRHHATSTFPPESPSQYSIFIGMADETAVSVCVLARTATRIQTGTMQLRAYVVARVLCYSMSCYAVTWNWFYQMSLMCKHAYTYILQPGIALSQILFYSI